MERSNWSLSCSTDDLLCSLETMVCPLSNLLLNFFLSIASFLAFLFANSLCRSFNSFLTFLISSITALKLFIRRGWAQKSRWSPCLHHYNLVIYIYDFIYLINSSSFFLFFYYTTKYIYLSILLINCSY